MFYIVRGEIGIKVYKENPFVKKYPESTKTDTTLLNIRYNRKVRTNTLLELLISITERTLSTVYKTCNPIIFTTEKDRKKHRKKM